MPGVNNYCIAVQEKGDDIIFLRKIIRGSADRSYGIQVAKLAGVPDAVIERAREIAADLEDSDIARKTGNIGRAGLDPEPEGVQISLFDTIGMVGQERVESPVEQILKETDLNNMTPIQALNLVYELKEKCK